VRIQEIVSELNEHWLSAGRVEHVNAFDAIEREIGQPLPADYKYFLMWSDGGETLSPLKHFTLYPLEELVPRRADGQPPGMLEFATDDSNGFAFDLTVNKDTATYPVTRYPLGDTERVEVEVVARDLAAFLSDIVKNQR